ncbi:MAG: hypothetical protein GTN81_02120 [Proteobacteria bacterium]|nr:hypothetical protein [Pseudomonadota bacterium]
MGLPEQIKALSLTVLIDCVGPVVRLPESVVDPSKSHVQEHSKTTGTILSEFTDSDYAIPLTTDDRPSKELQSREERAFQHPLARFFASNLC